MKIEFTKRIVRTVCILSACIFFSGNLSATENYDQMPPSEFFTDISSSTRTGFGFAELYCMFLSAALGYIAKVSLDAFRERMKG